MVTLNNLNKEDQRDNCELATIASSHTMSYHDFVPLEVSIRTGRMDMLDILKLWEQLRSGQRRYRTAGQSPWHTQATRPNVTVQSLQRLQALTQRLIMALCPRLCSTGHSG